MSFGDGPRRSGAWVRPVGAGRRAGLRVFLMSQNMAKSKCTSDEINDWTLG